MDNRFWELKRYKDAHLSKLEFPQDVMEKILKFKKDPKHFLLFFGAKGIGKSYFAAAYINYLIEIKKFYHFRHFEETQLYSHLKEYCIPRGWNIHTELSRLCESEYFILDDIGVSQDSEWQQEQFEVFVNERWKSMLPTIMISNYYIDDFREKFHERVIDRLTDKENIIIELDGESRRQNNEKTA